MVDPLVSVTPMWVTVVQWLVYGTPMWVTVV